MTILIVEDHLPLRQGLARILSRAGHAAVAVGTLTEGLACLDGQSAALVDLGLPDGSGSSLVEKIRLEKLPIHVALMTAFGESIARNVARQFQPDAIFTKPLDLVRLFQWLDSIPSPCATLPLVNPQDMIGAGETSHDVFRNL